MLVIKNVVESDWNKIKDDVMYDVLKAKFTQNTALKTHLLDSNDKCLVEGNPNDFYWAVGLSIYSKEIWNKSSWKGRNQLGQILQNLRSELRNS